MASFTDNIQALSTFNPYVEQQPIEEMRAVGMQKQQQYEQGVQRVQTSIDKVAGLDIMKDVDKQYLQSKLNTLSTNLQTVAAGDFSNFQLANSTAGLATKIGDDTRVQTAVGSTAKVRKQMEIANTAKVAGKSSVQNEWALHQQINSYLTDPEAGSSFNGEYTQYTDVDKKLRDVTEKLHEIDSSIDDPFMRNADGSHILDKQGKPIYDKDMMSIKTKGKSAERILNNFYSSLDENDINQLHIDASYHYRGATLDTFRHDAIQGSIEKKKMLNKSVVDMNGKLDTTKGLTAAQRGVIQAKINSTANTLANGDIEKELSAQLAQINSNSNPEEYKYKLYTQKSLTDLADALSYQSFTQEYKTNPGAQMEMEKKNLQFKYDNANREQSNFMARLSWDKQSFSMSYAQKAQEIATKKSAALGIAPITAPGKISTDVEQPSLLDVNKDISGIDLSIKKLNSDYAPSLTNSTLNTPQKKQTYLDYLARSYDDDPSTITRINDNKVREYLEKRRVLDIQRGQKQGLFAATVAHTAHFDKEVDSAMKTEPGLNHANGGKGYTAKQLYEFSKNVERFYKTTQVGSGSVAGGGGDKTTFDAQGLLDKYRGTSMQHMAEATVRKYTGGQISQHERTALDRTQAIKMKFDPIIYKVDQAKYEEQSKFLADRMPERQTMVGVLSSTNKSDMDLVNRVITAKGLEHINTGVDSDAKGEFDPNVINKLRENKNVGYTVEKKYDGSAVLHVTNGDKEQKIPMNAFEFSSYFPQYSRSNPVTDIKYAIMSSPAKTTNLKGGHEGANAVNAYMSGYDLPNLARTPLAHLVRLDVEGDGLNNGSDKDNYQVRMYVNDNGQWHTKILNTKGYVSEGGIQAILDNIGPNTVSDLLKNK